MTRVPLVGPRAALAALASAALRGLAGRLRQRGRHRLDFFGIGAGRRQASAEAVTINDYTYKPADDHRAGGHHGQLHQPGLDPPHRDLESSRVPSKAARSSTGKSASVKLEKAGTFAYYCVFHPFMKGTIVGRMTGRLRARTQARALPRY